VLLGLAGEGLGACRAEKLEKKEKEKKINQRRKKRGRLKAASHTLEALIH
jgi:hypothetical protein